MYASLLVCWSILCSGYQVMGDLAMLSKTWPFAEDVLTQPKRVVDLKVFAKMVSREDHVGVQT